MLPSEVDLQDLGWEGSREDVEQELYPGRSESARGRGSLEGTACCWGTVVWLSSAGLTRLDSSDRVGSLDFSWIFINHNSLSREDDMFGKRGTAIIFLFFKRLAASARMPSSCTQHHTASPACSFPNDCHLPPCPALHGWWKPMQSYFSALTKFPAAPPLCFIQKYHKQIFSPLL